MRQNQRKVGNDDAFGSVDIGQSDLVMEGGVVDVGPAGGVVLVMTNMSSFPLSLSQ